MESAASSFTVSAAIVGVFWLLARGCVRLVMDAPESDRDPEAFGRRVDAIVKARAPNLSDVEDELDQRRDPSADEIMADYDARHGKEA